MEILLPTDRERQNAMDQLVQLLSSDERVAALDKAELLAAIEAATRGYLAELHRGDPALAGRLEPALLQMVAASARGG